MIRFKKESLKSRFEAFYAVEICSNLTINDIKYMIMRWLKLMKCNVYKFLIM